MSDVWVVTVETDGLLSSEVGVFGVYDSLDAATLDCLINIGAKADDWHEFEPGVFLFDDDDGKQPGKQYMMHKKALRTLRDAEMSV